MYGTIPIQGTKEKKTLQDRELLLLATALVHFVSSCLLISASVFAIGLTINVLIFPFAVLLTLVLIGITSKCYYVDWKRVFFRCSAYFLIILIASIFIAGSFFDTTVDGLVYHQEAVYQLANGWNPSKSLLPENVSQAIWVNHYPKGAEIPQAVIYAFTKSIETGKATNILLLIASFLIALVVLGRVTALGFKSRLLLAFVASFNPVSINQVFTFYVDGQIAALLLMILSMFVLVNSQPGRNNLLLLGSLIVITINVKFTSLVFVVIAIAGFLGWLLVARNKVLFRKFLFVSLIAGTLGLIVVGFNPYVRNTIAHHHPFYPLMGKGRMDIIKESYPIGFSSKGRFEKFIISFFAHTDNEGSWAWEERAPKVKVPFTLNNVDVENARTEDTRVGGFGPLFSGITIIALLLAMLSFAYRRSIGSRNAAYIISVLLITVFIIPECWWARYVPQLWLLPILFLLIAIRYENRWMKYARRLISFLLFLNIGFAFLSWPYKMLSTAQLKYQLAQLKASGETIHVNWNQAKSNRIRFDREGIPFVEDNTIASDSGIEITGSDSRFRKPAFIPKVKVPRFLKLWRKFKPSEKPGL